MNKNLALIQSYNNHYNFTSTDKFNIPISFVEPKSGLKAQPEKETIIQRVEAEMHKFLEENQDQLDSLVKECELEGDFDQPSIKIGNQKKFTQQIREITKDLKKRLSLK